MKNSFKTGFSFGSTSGIITTLGLIVGLNSGTGSKMVIIGGVLTIAIADAFSDALGIHISEEARNKHTPREIWEATIATFLFKFCFAIMFVFPILFLPLKIAINASIIFGLLLLGIFSYLIGKKEKIKTWKVVAEHLIIAIIVVIATHLIGDWVGSTFN